MPRFRYFVLAGRFSAGTPFLHDFSARADKEQMPPGAPPRCTDGCPHAATCIYDAVRFYRDGIPMMRDIARSENIFVKGLFRTAMRYPRLVRALFRPCDQYKWFPGSNGR